MRFFCIDYGLERTGLAVSDPEGRLAFPVKTLFFSDFPTRKAFLDELACLITEALANALVIGLPLPLEGEETLICRQIRNIARRLSHRISIPIYFMNEALTSSLAEEYLRANGVRTKKWKAVLDQEAAVCILEFFLSAYEHGGEEFLRRSQFTMNNQGGGVSRRSTPKR
ncbi:MAG: Holliday junction resolvase RuvX [Desulfovibrio sp.]|nr:Holliday junction resolvase RuvX [Desulfovibrio sp.]